MLIVKDDIFISGFDGEARFTLAERRRKRPAARDVARLINSIDYSVGAALERTRGMAPDEHGRLGTAAGGMAQSRDNGLRDRYRRDHEEHEHVPVAERSACG